MPRKPTWAGFRDEFNLGQLCRERLGADAALIGFGTHVGTVACASDWDGPMEIKQVNPSRPDAMNAWRTTLAFRGSCST